MPLLRLCSAATRRHPPAGDQDTQTGLRLALARQFTISEISLTTSQVAIVSPFGFSVAFSVCFSTSAQVVAGSGSADELAVGAAEQAVITAAAVVCPSSLSFTAGSLSYATVRLRARIARRTRERIVLTHPHLAVVGFSRTGLVHLHHLTLRSAVCPLLARHRAGCRR